ncbi:MAG: aminotransferase class V-fold PLP-dependent enzyme [Candidatus Omnitrophica bacterium]|nr:aminotransferase class V-fold PLP-dependent enzyme [Candidatus Omnitrophota bacterium]
MSSFWEKIRRDFPLTRSGLYLDHAAGGPLAEPVRIRMQEALRENALEADFAWPRWMKRAERCRAAAAKFIHAEPEEIAFVSSTSQAVNAAAEMLAGEGSVLTNVCEFPSSTLPWIWRKAKIFYQKPRAGGILALEDLQRQLRPEVKTIVTSSVQYATGFRQDLEALGQMKGRRYLVVNATQSLGAVPFNVKACNADIVCSNSYKWLMAGYGGGLMYIRSEILRKFKPASIGWRSVKDPDAMKNRKTAIRSEAARYEMGVPGFPAIFAVGAAIEYLMDIGIEKIFRRILELSAYAAERLEDRGFRVLSPREERFRSGIVIAEMNAAVRVWKRLLARGVFVSPRGGGLRIGPHFYNTPEEIDRLVEILSACRDEESRNSGRKGVKK